MFTNYKLSAIPSPKDDRDYPITKLVPRVEAFPNKFCLDLSKLTIKDQGDVGSCVAHSVSYTRELTEWKQSGNFKNFSVGFIYANRSDLDYQGEGMYPREALQNLKNYGDVLQEDFPYNNEFPVVKDLLDQKKEELLKKADPFKVTSYCALTSTNDIKSALMQLGAVTACFPIYTSFYNTFSNGYVPMPNINSEKLEGYHEMTIVGWKEDNTWIVVNSWGSGWGDKGKCYISFNFPIVEAWSITDSILPQPSPNPFDHKFYRLQLGAFKFKFFADRSLAKFRSMGYNAVMVNANGYYKIQLGSFINKVDAEKLMKDLKSKKIESIIVYY